MGLTYLPGNRMAIEKVLSTPKLDKFIPHPHANVNYIRVTVLR